jgi:hypothetical protein
MCSIAAVGGTNQHLAFSLDRGYSQEMARHLAGVGVQHRGSPADGMAGGPHAEEVRDAGDHSLVAASIPLLLASGGSRTPLYLFARVFGIALGGEYDHSADGGELFGVTVLGRVLGIVLTADGVAEATAPMLVGFADTSHAHRVRDADRCGAGRCGVACPARVPRRHSLFSKQTLRSASLR